MKTRKEIEEYEVFVIIDYWKSMINSPYIGLKQPLIDIGELKSAKYIYRYDDCEKEEDTVYGIYCGDYIYPKEGSHPYYEKGEDGEWKLSEYYAKIFDKEENK